MMHDSLPIHKPLGVRRMILLLWSRIALFGRSAVARDVGRFVSLERYMGRPVCPWDMACLDFRRICCVLRDDGKHDA